MASANETSQSSLKDFMRSLSEAESFLMLWLEVQVGKQVKLHASA